MDSNYPSFSAEIRQRLAEDPEEARLFLDVAMEDWSDDGDDAAFLAALRLVVEGRGQAKVADAAKIPEAELARLLAGNTVGRWETINQVIHALGLRLAVVAAGPPQTGADSTP